MNLRQLLEYIGKPTRMTPGGWIVDFTLYDKDIDSLILAAERTAKQQQEREIT